MIRALNVKQKGHIGGSDIVQRYYSDISKTPLLTMDEEVILFNKYHEGDETAKEKIIVANQRFVVSVAKKYAGKNFDLLDLISEGNTGLIRAVETYDVTKGFKFISYAVWWIRQRILAFMKKSDLVIIKSPNKISKYVEQIKRRIANEEYRDATQEEIIYFLKKDYDIDVEIKDLDYNINMSSIDEISDDGLSIVEHSFNNAYHSHNDVENTIQEEHYKHLSHNLINMLSSREQKVIRMFYGIGYDNPYNVSEIGKSIGCTGERTRQIKERAIRRMRGFGKKLHQKKRTTIL